MKSLFLIAPLLALAATAFADGPDTVTQLVRRFNVQVELALNQLRATTETSLTEPRDVGRGKIPSTVIGLLVHAAEHTTRHLGQLLVTARWVRSAELTEE